MPTKIKLILTFFSYVNYEHYFLQHFIDNEYIRSSIIFVISIIMVFGLWVLPEATREN